MATRASLLRTPGLCQFEQLCVLTRIIRPFAATTAAAALLLAVVPRADAHISVDPREAEKGSYTKLEFRVPNERAEVGTTAVEINLPTDHPLAFVTIRPHQGWSHTVERTAVDEPFEADGQQITEVVSTVTFTGGPIRPGEFDQFEIFAGPLPDDADQLVFPALQTYEDGEVVRWTDEAPEGEEPPEQPAPVLRLVDPGGGEGDTTTTAPADRDGEDERAGELTVSNTASQDDVDRSQLLALVALIVGLAGLVAGGWALLRGR